MDEAGQFAPPARAGDFQYEIYARGLAGETPALPLRSDALEEAACEVLSAEAFGYTAPAQLESGALRRPG